MNSTIINISLSLESILYIAVDDAHTDPIVLTRRDGLWVGVAWLPAVAGDSMLVVSIAGSGSGSSSGSNFSESSSFECPEP